MKRTLLAMIAAVAAAVLTQPLPAWAGSPVPDPSVLQPPPPPGSTCQADGTQVICQTTFDVFLQNEPVFDLPCGTVYETSTDLRKGLRWYQDGELVTRFVTQDVEGTWSLSPTGTGPTVTVSAHDNWRNTNVDPYADPESWPVSAHGNGIVVRAAGVGVIAHIAGLDRGDEHHGVLRFIDDPVVAAELCAVLQG